MSKTMTYVLIVIACYILIIVGKKTDKTDNKKTTIDPENVVDDLKDLAGEVEKVAESIG